MPAADLVLVIYKNAVRRKNIMEKRHVWEVEMIFSPARRLGKNSAKSESVAGRSNLLQKIIHINEYFIILFQDHYVLVTPISRGNYLQFVLEGIRIAFCSAFNSCLFPQRLIRC